MMEGGASELAEVTERADCWEEDVKKDAMVELDVDVNSVGARDVKSVSVSSKVGIEKSESEGIYSLLVIVMEKGLLRIFHRSYSTRETVKV